MEKLTIGYAICGSFCTINESLVALEELCKKDYEVVPIISPIVKSTDTRFIKKNDLIKRIEDITNKTIITEIFEAEPIGPKKILDALLIQPCTGNTLAKLANGITDTSVTMAAKATLRNNKPIIISLATNDALSQSAQNLGRLLNVKNIYFVPFSQDDCLKKPTSMIADFKKCEETLLSALEGKQIEPILL